LAAVWLIFLPSLGVIARSDGSKRANSRNRKSGMVRVGTLSAAAPSCARRRLRDLAHPHEVADAEKAFAGRLRREHRANMQVGEVAYVYDLQAEARVHRDAALQQAGDDLRRTITVGTQDGTEDCARQHGRQRRCAAIGLHEVECRALGQSFGVTVRIDVLLRIEPHGFIVDGIRAAHGSRRGGSHHDTLHFRSRRGAQYSKRPIASRCDQ
jgi:hypothetical protein